jgi:hypothetical protein
MIYRMSESAQKNHNVVLDEYMNDKSELDEEPPTVFEALSHFQTMRDSYVAEAWKYGERYESRMTSTILKGLVRRSRQYDRMFPVGISDDERMVKVDALFDVATILRTEREALLVSSMPHKETVRSFRVSGLSVMGESPKVNDSTLAMIGSCFEGVTALEALALTCGYEAADVVALSPSRVSDVFEMVLSTDAQLPWSLVMNFLSEGIDASVVASLMGSLDDVLAVSN